MRCIKCGGELETVTVEGVAVEKCIECSGLWFDFGELQDVLDTGEIEALKSEIDGNAGYDAVEAPCPRCGGAGRMVPVVDTDHGFRIDTCAVCYGHWLDGGELERLAQKGWLAHLKAWLAR